MSIQLARVNLATRKPAGTPWPKTFTEKQTAYFATWRSDNEPSPDWSARAAPVFDALRLDCQRGELEHTTTTERVPDPNWQGRPRMVKTGIQTSEPTRQRTYPSNTRPPQPPTIEVTRYNIAAAPLARWLEAQDVQPGELLQAWFKSQGVGVAAVEVAPPAPAAQPEAVLMPSPAVTESWPLEYPAKIYGYTLELYRVLKAAHDAGKPRPTARDVLDSWAASKPPNILEVMTDEFKYQDSNGDVKPTSIKALRTAIGRMTSER